MPRPSTITEHLMARTKQTTKKSTFGLAGRGSLKTALNPASTKTRPMPPTKISGHTTTSSKICATITMIPPVLQGPRTIDIGHVRSTMCCLCGTGGCVLEGCQIDNCSNAVCIENHQNHPCAPSVAKGAWLCPTHDGSADTAIQYDGNHRIDIQTIELVSFSEWEILLSATKLTFAPYNVSIQSVLSHPGSVHKSLIC
ncbi:hypothetical protein BC936DRAFT_142116 [Jimgerdemannia flammicorona]|uniref:Uncharacterized protein n=1 Tax=Jimgerdemannia flammicorona TaxID=994334 RepID=A0A433DFH6_9FUNG|nr:hypothetical protein BC936DRAFT_142116 [Jimgerdemannia flammicorona]